MATPTTLPAAWSSGDVLTAAAINNLRGAFRIMQVVTATYGTWTPVNSTTYGSTGLTASITPSATSSKILVVAFMNGVIKGAENAGNGTNLRIKRGTTVIHTAPNVNFTNTALLNQTTCTMVYLDSPSSTSSTTYLIESANSVNTSTSGTQYGDCTSTLTLFEISA